MSFDADRLVTRLNSVLGTFPLYIDMSAFRRDDGLIEIVGLGFPAVGDEEACVEWLVALEELDPDQDPDDLSDGVKLALPESFGL